MTKQVFQEWLVYLFKNYGMDPDEARIKFLTKLIGYNFGFKHDWEKVFTQLGLREKYFPSAAVIAEYLEVGTGQKTLEERAKSFVDEVVYLMIHKPKEAYKILGKEKYRLAKKIGIDPYGLLSGMQQPHYLKKGWVENAKREFEIPNNRVQLPEVLESVPLNNNREHVESLTDGLSDKLNMDRET